MSELPPCPTDDLISLISTGALKREAFDELCRHLQQCAPCARRLELISDKEDAFVSSLAGIKPDQLAQARATMLSESQAGELMVEKLLSQNSLHASRPLPSSPTLTLPCRIGPYDVQEFIDCGGMGEIYAARHVRLDRPAALKVLRSHRQDDPLAQERFLDEMRTVGRLQHPHLIQAYDAWEDAGRLYIVFERVYGKTLQQLLQDGAAFDVREIIRIALAVCSALEYAHGQGLVHRDIKPANIMIAESGEIKVLDLGLALWKSTSTSTKPLSGAVVTVVGTPGYMAPEQESSPANVDGRADVYSLGCVLRDLLNGGLQQRALAQQDNQVQGLQIVVVNMLADDNAARYQSMADVHRALTQVGEESPGKIPHVAGWPWFVWLLLWSGFLAVGFVSSQAWYVVDPKTSSPEELRPKQGAELREAELTAQTPVPTQVDRREAAITEPRPPSGIIPNSIGLALVEIPAGEFWMGASPEDPDPRPDESPQRLVQFPSGFWLGQHEVTVGEFRRFVAATGYRTEGETSGLGGWMASRSSSQGSRAANVIWSNPGYVVTDEHPVTLVTYADATQFCRWLSDLEGTTYRLPAEAEWEYACRAGTSASRSFELPSMAAYCWYLRNSAMQPRPVGGKHANPWGLFDMNGNVREWCADWYSESAYQTPIEKQPSGPLGGEKRVIRGGCFIDLESSMQSTHRGYMNPGESRNNQGFRVLREHATTVR